MNPTSTKVKSMKRILSLMLTLFFLTVSAYAQPRHLYITWEEPDTAHTQTIVFQTLDKATNPRVEVELKSGDSAEVLPAKTVMIDGLSRRVHRVTLTDLSASTTYRFRAGDDRYGMSEWKTFRTLPSDDSPITIVAGGDMYRNQATIDLLKVASERTPDVAIVGGDIAYANGDLRNAKFWDDWFDNWDQNLNSDDGHMVPMICAIGNHEVLRGRGFSKNNAPFYFTYLPQGGESYFLRHLGSEIDLLVLDSGHVTPHEDQVAFIDETLNESKARFKTAIYHVPLYPTSRPFEDKYSTLGREHWLSIFDKHGLDLAFENHDHVFKRSHPLRNNKVAEGGTIYLGEGSWGVRQRTHVEHRWYHVKSSTKSHVWMVQNHRSGLYCQALDRFGNIFDETLVTGATPAQKVEG